MMKTNKPKRLLDFTPLIILTVYAVVLILTVSTTNSILSWRNTIGLIALPINYLIFRGRHKAGVLFLGLILVLGLLGVLSYTPGLTSVTITLGFNDSSVEFWGQPIYLLWLIIHFAISGRYYIGICTKKYWLELAAKKSVQASEAIITPDEDKT